MALDGTYAGLKTSIAAFLNRDDLTAVIPDFITLAEAQMARRFVSRSKQGMDVPRRLVKRADAPFAVAAEYVAVPSDIMGPLQLTLTTSDGTLDLDYLDRDTLVALKTKGFYPGYTFTQPATGNPRFYSIVGGQIQILPVADQAYEGELTYISRTPALSDANPTNWLLIDYPDVYLEGAQWSAKKYLKYSASEINDQLLVFMGIVDDICNADPMPTDKSTLRTDIALIQRFSRSGGSRYDISTDTP